jgi:hypothetical protein
MPVLFDKAVKLSWFDKLTTNGFNKLIFQQVGARHTVPLPTEAFPRTPTPLFYLGYNI